MEDIFQPGGNWERRYAFRTQEVFCVDSVCSFLAVTRLFRIVLDVISPFFHVEDRQWRSSVIEVFYRYFGAIWMDERVSPTNSIESNQQFSHAFSGRNPASCRYLVTKFASCAFRSHLSLLERVIGKCTNSGTRPPCLIPCTVTPAFSKLEM